jgi:hypothetical protein
MGHPSRRQRCIRGSEWALCEAVSFATFLFPFLFFWFSLCVVYMHEEKESEREGVYCERR